MKVIKIKTFKTKIHSLTHVELNVSVQENGDFDLDDQISVIAENIYDGIKIQLMENLRRAKEHDSSEFHYESEFQYEYEMGSPSQSKLDKIYNDYKELLR